MGAWQFGRTATGTVGLVGLALATWAALSASAQPPRDPVLLPPQTPPQTGSSTPNTDEPPPPLTLPIQDPDVQPAQFARPTSSPTGTGTLPPVTAPARPVPDPPAPVVRIQVRVPADAPPDDTIKYIITIQNTSQADAHQVVVRNPLPAGAEKVEKAEPKFDRESKLPDGRIEYLWLFGTLKPGEKKTIELVLKPKSGVTELKNLAYVRFEHGEAVVTRIAPPDVKVTMTAPKQSVKDEPYLVRVTLENRGRVPAEKVRVVENVNRAAVVEVVTEGGERTKGEETQNQWEWEVGTLLPGQRKVIEYRVAPRVGGEALSTTIVSAAKGVQAKAETRTEVLIPGLGVELKGPQRPINPGEDAEYEVVVHNNDGTLAHTNVRVTASIPAGCKPTKKTADGQIGRDAIVWTIPRLEPKKSYSFRYKLRAETTGQRTVTASAVDARNVKDTKAIRTFFQGTVGLVWETHLDPGALAVGQQGTFTIIVRNNGGDPARNVQVTIELPPEVGFMQGSPNGRQAGSQVIFGPDTITGRGELTYTVTYKARQGGNARFQATLAADDLKDRPLTAEKVVTLTGGK